MQIDFVSLFPEVLLDACRYSMLGRAQANGFLHLRATNPRDFAEDAHRTVDDTPYGGGPGMVIKPDVVAAAIASLQPSPETPIVICEPNGRLFTQSDAQELSRAIHLILVCGHYEGIDDRVRQAYTARVFSIGDYVLTGGELPALVIADAVARLVPGVLGSPASLLIDSHAEGLLSAPQFTRPEEFEGLRVPEPLRSGDHRAADRWKRGEALQRTRQLRPDLFCRARLAKDDPDMLSS